MHGVARPERQYAGADHAQTRQRVRQIALDMGYQPNRLARDLGRRKTDTIGLMISGLRNPFFVGMMEAAEQRALEAGYQVLVDSAPSTLGTYSEHGKMRGWPVNGVLMWANGTQTLADYLGTQATGMPVVYLGYIRRDDVDWAAFDMEDAGRQAATHLIERGYRKIAYLSPYLFGIDRPEDLRLKACMDVCREAGCALDCVLLQDAQQTRAAGFAAAREVAALPKEARPDAVICHNDVIALGFMQGALGAGLRVPEDIAIVGFDGIEETQYQARPLSTVSLPPDELCARALDILMARLRGEGDGCQSAIVPVRLIAGGTT